MPTSTPARGVAIREFSLGHGFGEADYLLFVDGQAAGVIEAKKEGTALVGVEIQTQKYSEGIPEALPAPVPALCHSCYQSTGIETRFTNLLEPDASSRGIFSFHTAGHAFALAGGRTGRPWFYSQGASGYHAAAA